MRLFPPAITALLFLFSCQADNAARNPYLPDVNFNFQVNLNLPLYSSLKIPLNTLYIPNEGAGVKGVLVINTGAGFMAWEASCPNHTPSSCSTMMVVEGINCQCTCENYKYSLITGGFNTAVVPEEKPYSLLNYRANLEGDVLVISN